MKKVEQKTNGESVGSNNSTSNGLQNFVGLSIDRAQVILNAQEARYRVTCKDGVYSVCTRDYNPNRYNFHTTKGVITSQKMG